MSQSNLLVANSKPKKTKGSPPTLLLVAFFFFKVCTSCGTYSSQRKAWLQTTMRSMALKM